ncbi:MAG: hypothetical protein C5B50_21040 [Verrucomicrobia bacterium]|nr:MAG: hypothetical protein C5B50_21040 [Verrucomicrobiota bacterium]
MKNSIKTNRITSSLKPALLALCLALLAGSSAIARPSIVHSNSTVPTLRPPGPDSSSKVVPQDWLWWIRR